MRPSLPLSLLLLVVSLDRGSAQCPAVLQKAAADQKYEEARAETQAQVKQNSSDDAAVECMGRLYLAEGKSGDAVDWFERAIKINEKNALHHLF